MKNSTIDTLCINNIAFLGIDMINKANSGHPGIVLGSAPMLYTLFTKHLNVCPKNPSWFNRDRFVLSAGHGSALLYSLLYFSGYKVSLDDLMKFRDFGITPGHPEFGHTPGVEATTGPLGQGIGNAVGMAISEAFLASKFNKPNFNIVDHHTYVLCGDGDLQEGVAWEAISLAGHLKLNKLVLLFDSNDIQLDGKTSLAISDNNKLKFEASGWNYLLVKDGSNVSSINKALAKAKLSDKPTVIEVKTIIGHGSVNENTSKVHGSPLSSDDIINLKQTNGFSTLPFHIERKVKNKIKREVYNRGEVSKQNSDALIENYKEAYPSEYEVLMSCLSSKEQVFDIKAFDSLFALEKNSTRNVIGKGIEYFSKIYPNLIGGSADLTSSTKAKGADGDFSEVSRIGRNINYGVREHAMGSVSNGIMFHGGLKTFTGTFFSFSDYMKPAIRIAAISKLPNIFIFTHDSIAVGEDGPTHQPIEQLTSLRSIPNLNVMRPSDSKETIGALKIALESKNVPSSIVLTRQDLPNLETTKLDISSGAYIVSEEDKTKKLDLILLTCGSETSLCLKTKDILEKDLNIRVVNMPSMFMFEKQNAKYKNMLLSDRNITIAVEMGTPEMWFKYAKNVYGIERFGESATYSKVLDFFGFTPQKLADYIKKSL